MNNVLKKLIEIISLISISVLISTIVGCNIAPRQYDPVEYSYVINTTINTTRAIHRCNDSDGSEFWSYVELSNTSSLFLDEYSRNKGDSANLVLSISQLRDMVNDVLKRRNFSNQYCVHKLSNIQASSRIISRVLGSADNINYCSGNIKQRFIAFKTSYDKKEINASEFNELVNDILKLEKIDKTVCSEATKQQMLEDLQFIQSVLPTLTGL